MNILKKIWFLIVLFIVVIIITVYRNYALDKALKDSTIVIGTIKEFRTVHSGTVVEIDFLYNHKYTRLEYLSYNLDSLKIGSKVRLRISKSDPANNFKYIGVLQ